MTSRERMRAIIAGQPADRCAFWLGCPKAETWPLYLKYFQVAAEEDLRVKLGDDFRWICPQFFADGYRSPDGRAMFDMGIGPKQSHGQAGPLADCAEPQDIEKFPWPDARYLNFDACLTALRDAGPYYRASGFWTCFYHNIMDLFGMENYMVNMRLNPAIVHAVTDRVCSFYYAANERFFQAAGDLVDGFFFGNDFGTQLDLICGPAQFDEFIMPWFTKYTNLAHRYGYQVILHSCGSIHKVIDRLIAAGVDCLHPLQALAADMDAATLAREFRGRIAFMGGIDTQQLLVHGTPREIKNEVARVKRLLGPRLIVSPSHEALLPNVPPRNVEAMAEEACRG